MDNKKEQQAPTPMPSVVKLNKYTGIVEDISVRLGGTEFGSYHNYRIQILGSITLSGRLNYDLPNHPVPESVRLFRALENEKKLENPFPLIVFNFMSPDSPVPPAIWTGGWQISFLPFSQMNTFLEALRGADMDNLKAIIFPDEPQRTNFHFNNKLVKSGEKADEY